MKIIKNDNKLILPLRDQEKFLWFYDWLGDFPKHWDVKRGKFLFRNGKELNDDLKCDLILSLTLNGVMHKEDLEARSLVPSDYSTYQIFYPNDLVFKLIDLENYQTSRVGIVSEKGIMSSAYIRLVPNKNLNSKFFYYYYYSLYVQGIYNFMGMGVRASLNYSDLLNIPVLVPPIGEQEKIVNYLDNALNEIQEFESHVGAKFSITKKYKASLIYSAVTGKIKI
ncbi:MAG: restriction endonuclease subunit S [Candidatus Pacebacteria bacterium]|jgi:type I restriction enzyme S subunit|nr:restriction endonuclease subunit S [Candidatus Paceibacterota bacterium]